MRLSDFLRFVAQWRRQPLVLAQNLNGPLGQYGGPPARSGNLCVDDFWLPLLSNF